MIIYCAISSFLIFAYIAVCQKHSFHLSSCIRLSLLQNHIQRPSPSGTLFWMLMTGWNKCISLLIEPPMNIAVTTHTPCYEKYCLYVTYVFMCLSLLFIGTISESSTIFLFIFGFLGPRRVSVRRLECSKCLLSFYTTGRVVE